VSSGGVPYGDMPNFLKPRRDGVPLSDAAVEALLTGTEPPAEAAPMLQPVADVLNAMRAGPASDELAGEAEALAEFRRATGASPVGAVAAGVSAAGVSAAGAPTAAMSAVGAPAAGAPVGGAPAGGRRVHLRRRRAAGSRFGARAAVTGAVAAVCLAGLTTAAFAGMLPTPIQRLAHDVLGAPAASPGGSHPGAHGHVTQHHAPGGKTGAAVHPACTAYTQARAHGTAAQRTAAYSNLVKAAGGAGHIAGYCGHGLAASTTGSHRPHPGKKKGTPPSHGKPAKKKTPPGQSRGKHKGHSKAKTSAHGHGQPGKKQHGHGHSGKKNQGHGHGKGAHKNPARHRAITSRSQ
jgi:hypothetical protein